MKKIITFLFFSIFLFGGSISWGQLYWRTDGTSGTWTGNNWSNPATLTGGTAWVANTDAIFSANSVVTFATTSIGNVTVDDGVAVVVTKGGTLSMNGAVRTFDIGNGSALTWTSQTVTANSSAGITKNGSGTLNLGALTFTTNMNGGFTLNNGTVSVTGAKALGNGSLTINGGTLQSSGGITYSVTSVTIGGDFTFLGSGNDIYSADVSLGASSHTITNNTTSGSRQFSGIISGNASVGLTINGSGSGTIILSGANTYTGTTTIAGTTLQLNRTGGTTLPVTNNVIINGGALQVSTNQTINDLALSSGNLTIDASTILTITGTFTYSGGSITNNGTIVYGGSSTLVYAGSSSQTTSNAELPSSNGPQNLTVSNSHSVILGSNYIVNGTLTLTSGNITTSGSNLLTLGASATISGGSSTSYINGPLALTYSGTGSKTFPIGSSSAYRPVTINATSLTGSGTITVAQTDANPGSTSLPGTIDKISSVRYWTITPDVGITAITANVGLTWDSDDGVSDLARVTVVHGTHGGAWDSESNAGGTTGDATSGTITGNGFNSFSDFTFGNLNSGTNPLPVEIVSFIPAVSGSKVNLTWQTATEVNNYGFEIERTSPRPFSYQGEGGEAGRGWETLGFVQGSGNSNSPRSYSFTDEPKGGKEFLYRLKQIDFDGSYEYSSVVSATLENINQVVLEQNFPNPFNPTTSIEYSVPSTEMVTLEVYNILGKKVATLVNEVKQAGSYNIQLSTNHYQLTSGVYYYRLTAGNYSSIKKMILLK